MNPASTTPATSPSNSSGAFAVTSLVLGILATVFSLFLIGGMLGIVGLILGILHLRRRTGRNAMAWWGAGLSVAGIGLSILFAGLYVVGIKAMMKSVGSSSALQVWQGVAAPDITVTTLDGQKITLSELKGKRVVLDFWATWCPPCRKEIPHFVRLFKETSREELVIVGISSEKEDVLREFAKKQGVNYPLGTAQDRRPPYSSVTSIPTTFFIDRRGIIQHIAVGYHDFEALKEHALEKDTEGEPKQPPPSPKPVAPAKLVLK